MKAFSRNSFIAILCAAALLSCRRERVSGNDLAAGGCRIKQLIMKAEGNKDKSGTFGYNSNGDPVSYTPTGYGNGSLKYEFRYDNSGRLTDYIGYDPTSVPVTCDFWAKYTYDNRNRIVRDSVYYNSNYGPALTSHANHIGVTTYEYDSKDRIGAIMYKQYHNGTPNGNSAWYKFDYNSAGNLITSGATYDDKASIFRTSKIWMFLNRNYSSNNLKAALSYNPKGLPVAFAPNAARGASMRFFESIDLSDCDILYECDK
jgi:hypothetical protein